MQPTKEITLNMEYLAARKLLLPELENVILVLIGCGGTGSWLAPHIVRYARLLNEKFDRDVQVTFIDPDKVEAKNVYRQNFAECEIGMFKADALAFRYGLAWGIQIGAVHTRFSASMSLPQVNHNTTGLTVFIGCVDNTPARREIAQRMEGYRNNREICLWLDAGNKKTVGQVLLGTETVKDNPLLFDGVCTWLPLPSQQHPELIQIDDDGEDDQPEDATLSCAELAMRGSQSLSINCRMAAAAGEMLGKALLTNDLEYYATYIDQATGETRKFITADAIQGFLDKKPETTSANDEALDDTEWQDEDIDEGEDE